MWYILYLLPIILWAFVSFRSGEMTTLSNAMSSLGLEILGTNQIYTSLASIFAIDGILPLFTNLDIILYMSYFISVFLIHLFVDFILFIPRLAHKWLNKLYQGD
jgi:hypothetical protein